MTRVRRDLAHAEGRPFFIYVGFTHFHPPWGVHPDFRGKSKAGIYADTKMEVDHNVGQILDVIDEAGIAGNTIVEGGRSPSPPILGRGAWVTPFTALPVLREAPFFDQSWKLNDVELVNLTARDAAC